MQEKSAKSANLIEVAMKLMNGIRGKRTALSGSLRLAHPREPLRIRKEAAAAVETKLRQQWRRGGRPTWTPHDENAYDVVERIRKETERRNRNNVTRTAAYWSVFRSYPELHWALLAHMVSRNGGWSMTDLRGEWLPKLLDARTAAAVFRMLESCNALIFRDAYPQLRLYEETRRTGRNLFPLLPAFGVSAFMAPFWERFRIDGDSAMLTAALIVNEQHVIEWRVVQDPTYRDDAAIAAAMFSQRVLQLNQIVFPLGAPSDGGSGGIPRLAGRILERFDDLAERIAFGKSLYAMLYAYPKVLNGVLAFAEAVPHSGSRADYWPSLFTADQADQEDQGVKEERARLNSVQIKAGGRPDHSDRTAGGNAGTRWFSPRLEDAWDDQPLGPVNDYDWLGSDGLASLRHMRSLRPPLVFDMTSEHELGQRKLQAATLAKDKLLR
ncbi:DUF2515 domain-containing protein [Cohnella lubricantis]